MYEKSEKNDDVDRPTLNVTVDYEKYAHFLDDADLSEEQKREFLQALWNIICEFVSLGFGVHPLQQAQKACGKLEGDSPKPALTAPFVVECLDKSIAKKFECAADPEKDERARESNNEDI